VTTPIAVMLGVLLIGGFFRSLQFTSLNALTYADIDKHDMGPASGLTNVAQQLSLSTGVTIGASVLEAGVVRARTQRRRGRRLQGRLPRRRGDRHVVVLPDSGAWPRTRATKCRVVRSQGLLTLKT